MQSKDGGLILVTATEPGMVQSNILTVCLVDDEPMMGALFSRVIQRTGCTVVTAENASNAISILEKQRIDIVLSDLMMPDPSDGEGLLNSIMRNFPRIPVIMMSGNMCPDTQARLIGNGAHACIIKPFTSDAFSTLIGNIHEKRLPR